MDGYENQAIHSYKNVAWNEDRMQICACRMLGDKTMVFCLQISGCRIFVLKCMHEGYWETGQWCFVSKYPGYKVI